MRVLFIGDSVTDCGRDRADPTSLGSGYPALVAAAKPSLDVVNRGISGNRAVDLQARWRADCLEVGADLVSVLIGINDTWRRYDSDDPTPVEQFEASCRDLLEQLRDRPGTAARLALCEPVLLPVTKQQHTWWEDLSPKREVVARLATEYGAVHVPFGARLQALARETGPHALAADGVHPTAAGHEQMARIWLETVSL